MRGLGGRGWWWDCRLRTRPEVPRHRRHVLAIDDPVTVDILRAAVARALVADHLLEIVVVDEPVTVDVPDTFTTRARAEVGDQRQQIRHAHDAVAIEVCLAVSVAWSEASDQHQQVGDANVAVTAEIPGARELKLVGQLP